MCPYNQIYSCDKDFLSQISSVFEIFSYRLMCPCFANWQEDSVRFSCKRKSWSVKRKSKILEFRFGSFQKRKFAKVYLLFRLIYVLCFSDSFFSSQIDFSKRILSTMPSSDDDDSNSSSSVSDDWNRWLPRRNLRETNWIYRVDALRPHDNREMDLHLRLSQGLLCCTMKFIVYAFSLKKLISSEANANIKAALRQVLDKVMGLVYIVQS